MRRDRKRARRWYWKAREDRDRRRMSRVFLRTVLTVGLDRDEGERRRLWRRKARVTRWKEDVSEKSVC